MCVAHHRMKKKHIMKQKTDYAVAATSLRSYHRHWRAKRLSWAEIGKITYLFNGAVEYMDDMTLAYRREHFNALRKALGFKQDSELSELVERSEAFRIVRNTTTQQMEAFMSPLVGDRFVPTKEQEVVEPAIPYALFHCRANALANDNDRDKIAENQQQHSKGIDMHVLLAGNVPKFHIRPNEAALKRMGEGLWTIYENDGLHQHYFGEFEYYYMHKYKTSREVAKDALGQYLDDHLIRHMACRVGIENWPSEAIMKWIRNYFGAKQLPHVVTQAHDNLEKYLHQPNFKI